MRIEVDEPCPLPDDPVLAEAAVALRDTDDWGLVVDECWRLVYHSDQVRLTDAGGGQMAATVIGVPLFGAEWISVNSEARFSAFRSPATMRANFVAVGGLMLADMPGGKRELRELVDPSLRPVVDELSPLDATTHSYTVSMTGLHVMRDVHMKAVRLRDDSGTLHGTLFWGRPGVAAGILYEMAFQRDPDYLQRTFAMSAARRRAGAVLFADLESSSALARRLSTSSYFTLIRRLVRVTDQCIADAGGLVGRHVGDGVVAFFPVENYDSESAAATACIAAARAIRAAIPDVAERSGLTTDDIVVRFGLHWGATLYMGSITTSARTEVTALGDEANETARIEACATGGRTLASKQLVERLDEDDAATLTIDLSHLTYTQLGELPTATDKARRDAPAIAVCQL